MDKDMVILLAMVGGFLIIIIAVYFIQKIFSYSEDIKFAKMELSRADDEATYRHWKREIRALRLSSVIPFMTPHRAQKMMRRKKRK